jgi:TP901 family phage tail tape measure protein
MTTIGGVDIKIRGDNTDFKRKMRETEQAAKRGSLTMRTSLNDTSRSALYLNQRLTGVQAAFYALGAAATAALGTQAVRTIATFEQAMSTLQGVTGATAAQMELLNKRAKDLGSSTRFSATQAAEGMTFLARAGFSVSEALDAIGPALDLAQAGGLDLGRAADIASNVLSGFQLEVAEAGRVMDVLALAANRSNTDVNQLGEALKFAAPTAVALGLGLEETVAVIGKLSDAGIQAGLAGRGFQSFSTQLVNNRDAITELIGQYDVATEGIDGVVKRLIAAGISTEQVIKIFRAENLDVFSVLADASTKAAGGVKELEEALDNAKGTAREVAKTMDDNLNGAILSAQSALEGLILKIGEAGASSAIRSTFEGLAEVLRVATRNMDLLAIAATAVAARALIPLAISTLPLATTAVLRLQAQVNLATLAFGRLGGAARLAGAAASAINPLTVAIAGAATAYFVLNERANETRETMEKMETALKNSSAALKTVADLTGKDGENPFQTIADSAKDAKDFISQMVVEVAALGQALQTLSEQAELRGAFTLARSLQEVQEAIRAGEADKEDFLRNTVGTTFTSREQGEEAFAKLPAGQDLRRLRQREAGLERRLTIALEASGKTNEEILASLFGLQRQIASGNAGNAPGGNKPKESPSLGEFSEQTLNDQTIGANQLVNGGPEVGRSGDDLFGVTGLRDEAGGLVSGIKGDAGDEYEITLRDRTKAGLKQAIETGDWGTALKQGIRSAAADGFSDAIDKTIDKLFDAFADFDFSGGGAIGNIFGFFGSNAGGGSVKAGRAYTVGELGPETFVPSSDGFIVPNGEVNGFDQKIGAVGAGGGINVHAPFIVQGHLTEDLLGTVDQKFAAYSQQLPRIIRGEMMDGRRRGR